MPNPDDLDADDAGGAVIVLDPELAGDLPRVLEPEHDVDGGEVGRREAGRVDLAEEPEVTCGSWR